MTCNTMETKISIKAAIDGGGSRLIVKANGQTVHERDFDPGHENEAQEEAIRWMRQTELPHTPAAIRAVV